MNKFTAEDDENSFCPDSQLTQGRFRNKTLYGFFIFIHTLNNDTVSNILGECLIFGMLCLSFRHLHGILYYKPLLLLIEKLFDKWYVVCIN